MKNEYTKEQVEQAVLSSKSYSDVFRNLGIKINGGSFCWLKNLIKRHGINTSHFLSSAELFNLNRNKIPSLLGVQKIESHIRPKAKRLKRLMLDNNIPYQCNCCKLSEWKGKSITLDIDHMDENCLNNCINNLQFLCPNCHRQKTQNKNP